LGKKLYMRVQDLYIHNEKPAVGPQANLQEVIMEITSRRLGATAVTDEDGALQGIITDGDLRRMLEKNTPTGSLKATDIMSRNPKTVEAEALAVEALDLMRHHDITQLVVTSGTKYVGFIHLHDLIREGII
jgi:arabinose-5-phosphate isomerase